MFEHFIHLTRNCKSTKIVSLSAADGHAEHKLHRKEAAESRRLPRCCLDEIYLYRLRRCWRNSPVLIHLFTKGNTESSSLLCRCILSARQILITSMKFKLLSCFLCYFMTRNASRSRINSFILTLQTEWNIPQNKSQVSIKEMPKNKTPGWTWHPTAGIYCS